MPRVSCCVLSSNVFIVCTAEQPLQVARCTKIINSGIIIGGMGSLAGSFIGGFIARLFSTPADGAIVHPAGIVLSVIGALILLYVIQHFAH